MADGKAGEGKAGEGKAGEGKAGQGKGKVPVAALRSNQLKKQLPTSQQSLQRSPSLDLP
uniref:Uncharacterized protein n=1 Tax=Theropithecus gelada TaxID=9565 RepID=A0A8D2EFA0_THEGE